MAGPVRNLLNRLDRLSASGAVDGNPKARGLSAELAPKQLQLLREVIPNAARFGVLVDPASFPTTQAFIADMQTAARTLGLQLIVVNARTDSDFEPAFATLSQQRVGAVLVSLSTFYDRRMEQLALAGSAATRDGANLMQKGSRVRMHDTI
jgi:ABC-type uncharacterized transport system substrate-binding protein